MTTPVIAPTTDMAALKTRLKATWMSGDYARFATYMVDGALDFIDTSKIATGSKVLDIGSGAGQTALPLARRGNRVTGADIALNLVQEARRRAKAENLDIQFDEADAEQLPYDDASFDVAFSLIGAMFAPQPDKVAAEMARVTRSGGRIIMANWTPQGWVGEMFRIIARYVPPVPGVPPAVLWGDEATVQERLGPYVSSLKLTRRMYPFHYPFSPSGVVDFFRANYGPTNRAFATLDADGQATLHRDLEQMWARHNQATDGSTQFEGEYLDVQAIRA